ncbi:MAG: aldo/keto reductase [Phycisphaeraceae bacterium]
MEKVTLGKTSLDVTRLGFGAANVGYLGVERDKVERIVNTLLDAGVNLIDTAECYPGSEELLGHSVAHRRDEFVLMTKAGHRTDELVGDAWSPELITQSVDQSLRRLRTNSLDIVLLHSCSLQVLEQGDALGALVKARDAGKARFIGYSGDNEAAAYAAGLDDVDVIEMSVNIVDQHNIDTVLPLCQQRELGVVAKRPLANACWKELSLQPGMYSQYAEVYTQRLAAMGLKPEDLGFQGHAEIEWPEIALRFTVSHAGIHSAIVGTTSLTNARANLAALAKGPLADDVVQQIRAAFASAQQEVGQAWPGQT